MHYIIISAYYVYIYVHVASPVAHYLTSNLTCITFAAVNSIPLLLQLLTYNQFCRFGVLYMQSVLPSCIFKKNKMIHKMYSKLTMTLFPLLAFYFLQL